MHNFKKLTSTLLSNLVIEMSVIKCGRWWVPSSKLSCPRKPASWDFFLSVDTLAGIDDGLCRHIDPTTKKPRNTMAQINYDCPMVGLPICACFGFTYSLAFTFWPRVTLLQHKGNRVSQIILYKLYKWHLRTSP